MGGLLVDVIKRQDNTMVQALVLIFATVGILGLLLGDLFMTLADPRTAAWLRGEAIPAETAAPGWAAVLADGFPLGFGKQSGGVVKNHYPKGLRNLK